MPSTSAIPNIIERLREEQARLERAIAETPLGAQLVGVQAAIESLVGGTLTSAEAALNEPEPAPTPKRAKPTRKPKSDDGRTQREITIEALRNARRPLTSDQLHALIEPFGVTRNSMYGVVSDMRKEGKVTSEGKGRNTRHTWVGEPAEPEPTKSPIVTRSGEAPPERNGFGWPAGNGAITTTTRGETTTVEA